MALLEFTAAELLAGSCYEWLPCCGGTQAECIARVFGDSERLTLLDVLRSPEITDAEKLACADSNQAVLTTDQRRALGDTIGKLLLEEYKSLGGAQPELLEYAIQARDSEGDSPGHAAWLAPGPTGTTRQRQISCAVALLCRPVDGVDTIERILRSAGAPDGDAGLSRLISAVEGLA